MENTLRLCCWNWFFQLFHPFLLQSSKQIYGWTVQSRALQCKEVNITYEIQICSRSKAKRKSPEQPGPLKIWWAVNSIWRLQTFFLYIKTNQPVFSGSSTSPKREAACNILEITNLGTLKGIGNHRLWRKVAGTSFHPPGRLMLQILGSSFKGQFILIIFWKNKLYSIVTPLIPCCWLDLHT